MRDKFSPFPSALALVLLLAVALPLGAAPTATATRTIDWVGGIYHLSIAVKLEEDIHYLPVARRNAEAYVQDRLPFLVLDSLADFPVTSSSVLRDYTDKDPALRGAVRDISFQLVKSVLSEDLTTLHLEYSLPIYPDLAQLFVVHGQAFPLEVQLGWVPGDDYTGLVIYAADSLPWWGEDTTTLVEPTLFPRLLDDTGAVVFSKENVDPQVVKNQGIVAYSRELSEAGFASRIGSNPLRCLASAAFGTAPTDIVLPKEVVDELFTRESNLKLLEQGRILIILPPRPTSQ